MQKLAPVPINNSIRPIIHVAERFESAYAQLNIQRRRIKGKIQRREKQHKTPII